MPAVILVSTLVVWLSTVAVMVPSSLAFERGLMDGVLQGTAMSVVMLLLGIALYRSMRKRQLAAHSGPFAESDIFLIVAWLPNAAVLAIINTLSLLTIAASGEHIGASGLIYILVPATWFWSRGRCSGRRNCQGYE